MRRPPQLALFLLIVVAGSDRLRAEESGSAARPLVCRVHVDNPWLTPVTVDFIEKAIQMAQQQQAECVVLVVNMSGGLLDSTRNAVQAIDNSPIPVVVYVAPDGAEATGPGFYFALAGHLLVLAPGTHIGQTLPADITLPAFADNMGETVERTVPNTTLWAQFLQKRRGRNGTEAAEIVTDHLLMTADKAVHSGVANFLADDFDDLLLKIHNQKVTLATIIKKLNTKGAMVQDLIMPPPTRFLAVAANPNIPFAVLLLGLFGALVQLARVGWGWLGYVSLTLLSAGLLGLAMLPIQYTGIIVLFLGCVFYFTAVFLPKYGVFTILGTISLVLGGVGLFEAPTAFMQISPWVVASGAVLAVPLTIFAGGRFEQRRRTLRAH